MSAAMQLHRQKKMAAGLIRDIKLEAQKALIGLGGRNRGANQLKCVAIHLSVASYWKQLLLTLTEQFLQ